MRRVDGHRVKQCGVGRREVRGNVGEVGESQGEGSELEPLEKTNRQSEDLFVVYILYQHIVDIRLREWKEIW